MFLLATDNRLFADIFVLDELLYISKKRYGISYDITKEFIDDVILPVTEISSLDLKDYKTVIEVMKETKMNPSDAIHVASMRRNDIKHIASENMGSTRSKQ